MQVKESLFWEKSLGQIIDYFREPLMPKKIHKLSDIKKYPNDIIMSRFLASERLDWKQLAYLLKYPSLLNKRLEKYACGEKNKWMELIKFYGDSDFMYGFGDYFFLSNFLCKEIERRSNKYCHNNLDLELVADKKKKFFTFPSGIKIQYYSLRNEIVANESIFTAGYILIPNLLKFPEIYIRENSITIMLAFAHVQEELPFFLPYRDQFYNIDYAMRAIIIAHELAHYEMFRSGVDGFGNQPNLKRELMAESIAKEFLKMQGINMKYYELIHLLRAGRSDKKGETWVWNSSMEVLKTLPNIFDRI